MAIDPEKKPKGNPNWKKGHVANPNGRGKGTVNNWTHKVQGTLNKLKRNPVEELIDLADYLKANRQYDLAAKIWLELQQYREAKRKPVEVHEAPQSPEESKENVEKTLQMLESLSEDNDGQENQRSSTQDGLATGETQISPEESTTPDVRGDQSQ